MAPTNMNPGQVRIVDPVLTTVAQGYKLPNAIGMALFPRVPVGLRGGQIIEFGQEAFKLYNTRRAPGTATARISFGYLGKPFALINHSLEAPVPREFQQDAAVMPGIDLGTRAVSLVMRTNGLSLEVEQANLARTAGNYDNNHKVALSGTDQWSDYDNSDPSGDVATWMEAIRSSTGSDPNTMALSKKVFNALKFHPQILDRIKYTGRDSVTTDLLSKLWEIPNIVVGGMITFDDTGAPADVWGKDVVLAYTALGDVNAEEPSYGYTYTLNGMPSVETPYWENQSKSWIYGTSYDRVPVQSGITAGFLAQTVVA